MEEGIQGEHETEIPSPDPVTHPIQIVLRSLRRRAQSCRGQLSAGASARWAAASNFGSVVEDPDGGAGGPGVNRQRIFGREMHIPLDAQSKRQADSGNPEKACVAQFGTADLAVSEKGVAVGIEFAEQAGAETARIEGCHHRSVVLLGVSAIGEKLLALSICEEFHFMRPPGSGWLAGNAGLGSVTSAGAEGVDTAIREAEMESGTADAFPRPGRKSSRIMRDPTLEAVGRRLRVVKGRTAQARAG